VEQVVQAQPQRHCEALLPQQVAQAVAQLLVFLVVEALALPMVMVGLAEQ